MKQKIHLAVAGAAIVLAVAACSDTGLGLTSEQVEVLAAFQNQLGAMTDSDFGDAGAVASASASATAGVALSPSAVQDTAIAPLFWGRIRVIRGGPRPIYHRDVTIQGDSAWVERDITFNGIFLVDTSNDATFNPTSKPLSEIVSQKAVFVRDQTAGHGWRAVALSPLQWQNTDVAKRTVQVQSVAVYRNDTLVIQVTDPDSLYDVVHRIPRFHLGDTVRVVAQINNSTGGGYAPPTFAFLHVRHADTAGVIWRRVPMNDLGGGQFAKTWIARRTGIDRFVVDGLDAATLVLGSGDNYRANEWGIPYRIE
jgi:hypothetical protein